MGSGDELARNEIWRKDQCTIGISTFEIKMYIRLSCRQALVDFVKVTDNQVAKLTVRRSKMETLYDTTHGHKFAAKGI